MDIDSEDIHTHCFHCRILSKCTVTPEPGISCEIIKCNLCCGAKFHACKRREHLLLCPNMKVPCINAENGCPALMLRKRQSEHLHSCPASVIYCPAEWNRCPIHVQDRKMLGSSNFQNSMQFDLDIALAMRDRRMLHHWCDEARQGCKPSEAKFEISPTNVSWIYKERQSSRESSRCDNAVSEPWVLATPGLEQSVCNELCRNSNHTHISLSAVPSCRQHHPTKLSDGDIAMGVNGCPCNKENDEELASSDKENDICDSCFSTKSKSELASSYTLEDVLRLSDCDSMFVYDELPRKGSVGLSYNSNTKGAGILTSTCVHPQNPATQISYFKFKNPSSTPPWCVPLGLDLNIESRMLHTSNFMYTFLCCQEFRRDEYGWHFLNVHCEIHSGLNGWLQERCPLAQYGCKFARKRFRPAPDESQIVYNEILDSFGVTSSLSEQTNEGGKNVVNGLHSGPNIILENCLKEPEADEIKLTQLPFEVLRYITSFLDSFSLTNLSLTSSLLRMVCASHLENRGLVVLKWKREKRDNRYTWKVDCKRWFFSSHFAPIHKWNFDDSNNMSNHLKSCSFFNRIDHRYRSDGLHYGSEDGLHQYEMSINADESAKCTYEHATTKL